MKESSEVNLPLNCLSTHQHCDKDNCTVWYVTAHNELGFPNRGVRGEFIVCHNCLKKFLGMQKENKSHAKSLGVAIY